MHDGWAIETRMEHCRDALVTAEKEATATAEKYKETVGMRESYKAQASAFNRAIHIFDLYFTKDYSPLKTKIESNATDNTQPQTQGV